MSKLGNQFPKNPQNIKNMKPKMRIFCSLSNRHKMKFKSESKAINFIRYNGDEIAAETGKKPIRTYYCRHCCGYHVTSRDNRKKNPTITISNISSEQESFSYSILTTTEPKFFMTTYGGDKFSTGELSLGLTKKINQTSYVITGNFNEKNRLSLWLNFTDQSSIIEEAEDAELGLQSIVTINGECNLVHRQEVLYTGINCRDLITGVYSLYDNKFSMLCEGYFEFPANKIAD